METIEKAYKSNPNIETLSLEFHQVQNLQQFLPYLSKFHSLRELSLHGNRLTGLPDDLSQLRALEVLDISNNAIQDISKVMKGLLSLPRLKNLTINFRDQQEGEELVHSLPYLEVLNSTVVREPRQNGRRNDGNQQDYASFSNQDNQEAEMDLGLKSDDLEAVAVLYDCIRELFKEQTPDKDHLLAEQFDDHVQHVMHDLNIKLNQRDSRNIMQTNVLKAKYALYEIIFSKIIEYIGGVDPRVSSILEGIHDAHALLFREITGGLLGLQKAIDEGRIGNSSAHKNNSKYDTTQLIEEAEKLEKENNKLKAEREQLLQQFEEERNELQDQIRSLEEENQKYLDKIIKNSKEAADLYEKQRDPANANGNVDSGHKNGLIDTAEKMNSYRNAMAHHNQQAPVGHTSVRALTLRQLKDMIEEIYTSKSKYDQKYTEAKLPRETMEQHMYTYLNQKYGLKNLIIEWATAIINGIKKFSIEDNDVAVFGKILRNECDEEFRFVQNQVKNTISELLKMYLRGKFPFKHNSEIKEMLTQKMNGVVYEEECTDIIKYMYNQEDSEVLLAKLRKLYTLPQKNMAEFKKLSREEQQKILTEKEKNMIEYSVFQKVILDFQLKSHEKFLKMFLTYYRLVDKDNNGIINEGEFKELIGYIQSHKIDADPVKLLMVVDPYSHQQITFSQCVALFSAEMIADGDNNLSILQKLSLDG